MNGHKICDPLKILLAGVCMLLHCRHMHLHLLQKYLLLHQYLLCCLLYLHWQHWYLHTTLNPFPFTCIGLHRRHHCRRCFVIVAMLTLRRLSSHSLSSLLSHYIVNVLSLLPHPGWLSCCLLSRRRLPSSSARVSPHIGCPCTPLVVAVPHCCLFIHERSTEALPPPPPGCRRPILTGMHGHGFCCKKGNKGKYMCCLVFKWGLHTRNTCPLLIILLRSENIAKKQHADVQAYPMDEYTIAM